VPTRWSHCLVLHLAPAACFSALRISRFGIGHDLADGSDPRARSRRSRSCIAACTGQASALACSQGCVLAGQRRSIVLQLCIAVVGLWTGLIVLDAATYLLVSLALIGGLSLQQASAVKVVLVGFSTVISLIVFIHGGEVDWQMAVPLMPGSALGGWLGASLALGPQARLWIYRLLLLALSFEMALMVWGFLHPSIQPMVMQ